MTLLISVFAAVICTIVWYANAPQSKMQLGTLCWLFWGSSLMWFVDACFEYRELGAEFFTPSPLDMLNDAYLGFSVVALGFIIWLIVLLVKDPKDVIKSKLFENKDKNK